MTPNDIRELDDRRHLEDDPAFIAGQNWARERSLNAPVVGDTATHDEWLSLLSEIKVEADRRYPGDVVAETRFLEGAKAWAGA